MNIRSKNDGGILVLTPMEDRIDASGAGDFKDAILKFVEEGNRSILLNLELVDFIDSSGLGSFITVKKRIEGIGEFAICNLGENVKSLFKLARMDKIFDIYENEIDGVTNL